MRKLYFQHSDESMEYICTIDDNDPMFVSVALEDLHKRAPHFRSYYQRVWTDDNDWTWIDVGDHSCFYVLKND